MPLDTKTGTPTGQPSNIVQFQKKEEAKFICSACGADRGCNCNAPAVEKLAQKQEQARQASKAYRERKAEENQQSRHMTEETPTEPRPTYKALRARAAAIGIEMQRDGRSYHLVRQDGSGRSVTADCLENVPGLLAVEEAKVGAPSTKATDDAATSGEKRGQYYAETEETLQTDDERAAFVAQCKRVFEGVTGIVIRKAEQGAGLVHLKGSEIDDEIVSVLSNVVAAWTELLNDVHRRRHDDPPPSGPGGEPGPKVGAPAETVPESDCPDCGATGTCPYCGGTGEEPAENAVAAAVVAPEQPIDQERDRAERLGLLLFNWCDGTFSIDPGTGEDNIHQFDSIEAVRDFLDRAEAAGETVPPVPLTPPAPAPAPAPSPTPKLTEPSRTKVLPHYQPAHRDPWPKDWHRLGASELEEVIHATQQFGVNHRLEPRHHKQLARMRERLATLQAADRAERRQAGTEVHA